MKKILSLALALILTPSAFVLPASAAVPSEETVEPCVEVTKCPNCANQVRYVGVSSAVTDSGIAGDSCTLGEYTHWHYVYSYFDLYKCVSCSYSRRGATLYTRTYCDAKGSYL